MKTNRYKLLLLGMLAAGITACGDAEIMTYDAQYDAVRFTGASPQDTLNMAFSSTDRCSYMNYSFIETPFAESTEYAIPVFLIGKPAASDRTVAYRIDPEKTTAPEGSYEILSASIPAGKSMGAIKVRLLNAEELSSTTYTLRFQLQESEELRLGPCPHLTSELSWNNSIPAPTNTNIIRSYNMLIAGQASFVSTSPSCISSNALKAIYAATGWDDWDDPTKHTIHNGSETYGYYKYLPRYQAIYTGDAYKAYTKVVADYLEQYREEHGEALLHDSGSLQGEPVTARTY